MTARTLKSRVQLKTPWLITSATPPFLTLQGCYWKAVCTEAESCKTSLTCSPPSEIPTYIYDCLLHFIQNTVHIESFYVLCLQRHFVKAIITSWSPGPFDNPKCLDYHLLVLSVIPQTWGLPQEECTLQLRSVLLVFLDFPFLSWFVFS